LQNMTLVIQSPQTLSHGLQQQAASIKRWVIATCRQQDCRKRTKKNQ